MVLLHSEEFLVLVLPVQKNVHWNDSLCPQHTAP
jgi:hypothetical protein